MFWKRVATLIRMIRTEIMAELQNPQALRQGVAVAAGVTVFAVALNGMAYRAGVQRDDALWAARAEAFQQAMSAQASGQDAVKNAAATVTLASMPTKQGWSVRAETAALADNSTDRHAMVIATQVRDRAALAGMGAFQPVQLRQAAANARQGRCLAEAIYFEARGESAVGQRAVAEVVLNRVRSPFYPKSFCDVVYQGSHLSTGCQFTFTCDGSLRHRPRGRAWQEANLVAAQVMMGLSRPMTHRATHYHTNAVSPYWSASLVETTRIGAHIFYRFPNRREKLQIAMRNSIGPIGKSSGELVQKASVAPADVLAPSAEQAT